MTVNSKFSSLKKDLNQMGRVIIAYSGGVDSTFLLKAASLSGLNRILAVTGSSESLPEAELSFSKEMTAQLQVNHQVITTEELKDINYSSNPADRCYYCKKELFSKLKDIAVKEDIPFILDGTNADDARDWRPGMRAAREKGVQSPLLKADLGKEEIREISQTLGLPTWNKPATPCLSSRFAYGQNITAQALSKVDRAENFIRKYGFKDLRVRVHAETARIEVSPEDFHILTGTQVRNEIISFLRSLGYKQVTLDLQGFRSGSLNE
jgi:uncharacterized protein